MCTDGVRVFTVDDGWGWIFTAVEHWNAECVLACLQARRPLRRPAADLHGACRAVWLDRGRRGSGAGLADGSRLPVSVGPLHPTRSSSGASRRPYAFVAEPQTRRRAVQSHAEGTDHPWSHLLATSRSCGTSRPRLVELYNAQWIVEKNGYLSPAQARQAWHAAISIEARRVSQTSVQGTGCATQKDATGVSRHLRRSSSNFPAQLFFTTAKALQILGNGLHVLSLVSHFALTTSEQARATLACPRLSGPAL